MSRKLRVKGDTRPTVRRHCGYLSVDALYTYVEPARPFLVLALDEKLGKRLIDTRVQKSIQIRVEDASTALEVISRFSVNPKWLV